MGGCAGSTLLATWLAGTVYERAAGKQGQQVCKGPGCFRVTYLVEAGLAGAACVAAVLLWRRCQHLYDRVAAVTRDERGRRGLQARPCLPVCLGLGLGLGSTQSGSAVCSPQGCSVTLCLGKLYQG